MNTKIQNIGRPINECEIEDRTYWVYGAYRYNKPMFSGIMLASAHTHDIKIISLVDFLNYVKDFGLYMINKQVSSNDAEAFKYHKYSRSGIDRNDYTYIIAYLLTSLYPIANFDYTVEDVLDKYLPIS